MPPEARITQFLRDARRRATAADAARIFAASCAIAAVYVLARAWAGAPPRELFAAAVVALILALTAAVIRGAGRAHAAAADVERRTSIFRNALITSAEMIDGQSRVKPHIRELVLRDTASRIEQVDLRAAYPARRPAAAAALSMVALAAALTFGVTRPEALRARESAAAATSALPSIARIEVSITPPAYTRLAGVSVTDPDRIEMIEGSRLSFRADSDAQRVTIDAGGSVTPMAIAGTGMFVAEIVAAAQSYVALTPSSGIEGSRRLIVLSITPDRAPDVRIGVPGRDMFLSSAARDIPVEITARDDFGVTSLALAYTKVSGSGETFAFVEGTLPLTITRTSDRDLSARAVIRPAALGLAAGDMLVYRAVARDGHPTRGAVESDAFVIDMLSPSQAMAEGFSIDDQRDKYALSQQMVILKTERLLGARAGMTAEAVTEAAALIAAEQRQVRAEFVFMMGGEVEDEEVEAEQSAELEEGREQNRGRRDLLAAIRNMSDASALLMRPDLTQALEIERRALAALQRALTRSRYILRVLSPRERIDDTRRLSGDRSTAATWRRARAQSRTAPYVERLREALLDLSRVARLSAYGAAERAALTRIAENLLKAGSPGASAAEAAALLTRAARARDGDTAAIARLIDEAAIAVDTALEAAAQASAAARPHPRASDRIRSALADRLRGGNR